MLVGRGKTLAHKAGKRRRVRVPLPHIAQKTPRKSMRGANRQNVCKRTFHFFFHPDCTVGIGIAPIQPLSPVRNHCGQTKLARGLYHRSGISPCPEEIKLSNCILAIRQMGPNAPPQDAGAANEARTRYLHLGKVALYQMSYGRTRRGVSHPSETPQSITSIILTHAPVFVKQATGSAIYAVGLPCFTATNSRRWAPSFGSLKLSPSRTSTTPKLCPRSWVSQNSRSHAYSVKVS